MVVYLFIIVFVLFEFAKIQKKRDLQVYHLYFLIR